MSKVIILALLLSSCAAMRKAKKQTEVKVVGKESAKELRKCKKVGKVKGFPEATAGGEQREYLIINLKNKAAEANANVVLSDLEVKLGRTFLLSNHIRGAAYNCPELIYDELIDIGQL